MNKKCEDCLWKFNGECCSESLEDLIADETYKTENCVGFLEKDYYKHMLDMKSELLVFCGNDNPMSDYIKNMSYKQTVDFYESVLKDLEK